MAVSFLDVGTLNRIRASVQFPELTGNDSVTVTSSFLGEEGIRLSFETPVTDLINVMVGMVASPTPYQACTLTIALVKSMYLSDQFKRMMENNAQVGLVNVIPDAQSLSNFVLHNMYIENVREMSFAGRDAVTVVTLRGYRIVNKNVFN